MHRIHLQLARRPLQLAITATAGLGLCLGLLTTPSGASAASQKAAAKKTLLGLADVPKGWSREKGSVSGQSGYPGQSSLTTCIGDTSSLITSATPPEVDSPFFQNKAQSQEIQDSVTIFPSNATARAEYSAISNAKTPGCEALSFNGPYKSQLEASAGKGTTVGTITVSTQGPGYFGPHTSSYTMNIPISSQGTTLLTYITSVYFIRGDFGQQLTLNSYGAKPDLSLLKHLTAVAIHRL